MSQLFASGGQSIGASTSASVLPVNIQGGFPLRLGPTNSLSVPIPPNLQALGPVCRGGALNVAPCWTPAHLAAIPSDALNFQNAPDVAFTSSRRAVVVKVAQSYPTLCSLMDYTVRGLLQARILE